MVDRCADCNVSLGTQTQETLFGLPKRCPVCERNYLAASYLKLLPDPDEREWETLNDWEREFLTSVRRQFATRKTVSEAQFEKLEQVYRRHA